MLVGDILQSFREAITDQPPFLPAPTTVTAAVVASTGSTLPAGNYFVKATFRTPWGETTTTAESAVLTVAANQGIQVTAPALPPGASVIRVYLTLVGGVAGSEQQFVESATLPFTISAPGTAGLPPTRNTAYLPDNDGDSFSAATLYRWLNDALKLASQICGGLLDYSGISTVSGQPLYIVPGQWKRITDVWYDGYPLAMDTPGNFFRRNAITASVLASIGTSLFTDRMAIEVWPQPARTAAATTLATALAATDTQAVLVSAANFLLTNGFVQIGSEILAYSGITGNTLNNLTRALSGTVAAAAAIGGAVNELNLFWGGWRKYAPAFVPGNALNSIPVPVGWEPALPLYGLARAKLAEQNTQEYKTLRDDFEKILSDWFRTNKVTTGPRQVGEQEYTLEVYGTGLGGGWVIP